MQVTFSLPELLSHAATELVRAQLNDDEEEIKLWRQAMKPAIEKRLYESVSAIPNSLNPYAGMRLKDINGAAWINAGGPYEFAENLTKLAAVRMYIVRPHLLAGRNTFITSNEPVYDCAAVAAEAGELLRRENGGHYYVHAILMPISHVVACEGVFFHRHQIHVTSPVEVAPIPYSEKAAQQRLTLKTCCYLIMEAVNRHVQTALEIEQSKELSSAPF